jgi:hypothetical protein
MNPLKTLFEMTERKPYRVADSIQMSRSYIYKLISLDELPKGIKLGTLIRIADEVGYSIEIRLVPEKELEAE